MASLWGAITLMDSVNIWSNITPSGSLLAVVNGTGSGCIVRLKSFYQSSDLVWGRPDTWCPLMVRRLQASHPTLLFDPSTSYRGFEVNVKRLSRGTGPLFLPPQITVVAGQVWGQNVATNILSWRTQKLDDGSITAVEEFGQNGPWCNLNAAAYFWKASMGATEEFVANPGELLGVWGSAANGAGLNWAGHHSMMFSVEEAT